MQKAENLGISTFIYVKYAFFFKVTLKIKTMYTT